MHQCDCKCQNEHHKVPFKGAALEQSSPGSLSMNATQSPLGCFAEVFFGVLLWRLFFEYFTNFPRVLHEGP